MSVFATVSLKYHAGFPKKIEDAPIVLGRRAHARLLMLAQSRH